MYYIKSPSRGLSRLCTYRFGSGEDAVGEQKRPNVRLKETTCIYRVECVLLLSFITQLECCCSLTRFTIPNRLWSLTLTQLECELCVLLPRFANPVRMCSLLRFTSPIRMCSLSLTHLELVLLLRFTNPIRMCSLTLTQFECVRLLRFTYPTRMCSLTLTQRECVLLLRLTNPVRMFSLTS